MPPTTNIYVVGKTGAGKSALCKAIAEAFASGDDHPFQDSSGSNSDTKVCSRFTNSQGDCVTDTPGQFDSDGDDNANIREIVNSTKEYPYLSLFLLVVDGSENRLDESIQSTFEILGDSFGPGFVSNLGIFYSKVTTLESRGRCEEKTNMIANALRVRTGHEVSQPIPFWCCDTVPRATAADMEETFNVKISEDNIERKVKEATAVINEILTYARGLPPVSTVDFAFGEYLHTKQLREEKEAKEAAEKKAAIAKKAEADAKKKAEAAEKKAAIEKAAAADAKKKAEAAEKKRIYDASVISTKPDTKVDIVGTVSWVKKKKVAGFNGGKIVLNCYDDRAYMIEHTKVESQRTITTYGSGVKSYGDWKVVKEFKHRVR